MILLDHCLPRRYLRLLREWGYQAVPLTDHLPADAADAAVIGLAGDLDAVLLTLDLDFSNILDYPPAKHGGIIVLRYQIEDEAECDHTLRSALATLYRDDLRGALVVVTAGRYRIRG